MRSEDAGRPNEDRSIVCMPDDMSRVGIVSTLQSLGHEVSVFESVGQIDTRGKKVKYVVIGGQNSSSLRNMLYRCWRYIKPEVVVVFLNNPVTSLKIGQLQKQGVNAILDSEITPASLAHILELLPQYQITSPHMVLSTDIRTQLSESLTPREEEVLGMVAAGHDNLAIAERLGIKPKTVEVHLDRVRKKLDVGTRAELVETYKYLS